MPSPTSSLATLRPDLAGSFTEFDLEMQRRGFIASRVLPVMNVAKQAGPFGKIPIEQLLARGETKRGPGSGYNRSGFTFTTDSYACEEHGHEEPVDDREAEMYADYFDAEQVAAARAFETVLSNAEQRAAALLFDPAVWTGAALTTAPTHEWDDPTNAVPITDVENAAQKVYDGCGMWPNTLIITRKVARNLRLVSQVQDLLKYSGHQDPKPGNISIQALAEVFDLDQILVGDSVKNTADEGQTASLSSIWSGEYAMVCRVPVTNDIREPGVGRTFHWAEDGSSMEGTIETYRDETVRSDIVRVRHDVDEKVLYTEAAHLISNITT